jgi:hypothetical protein
MEGSHGAVLQMFRRLCGRSALRNLVFVTTMWDLEAGRGESRERELRKDFSMTAGGSRMARFDGSLDSAWEIIDMFWSKPTCDMNLAGGVPPEERERLKKAIGVALSKHPVLCWLEAKG